MKLSSMSTGLVAAVIGAASFGTSGTLVKPLLVAGWSPTAAVTARAITGGLLLLPLALVVMRGRWDVLRRAWWRVLVMGVVGVAFTQLAYFAAIRTIPVSTALLIEFQAPLILVGYAWARTRRRPHLTVLLGSVMAVAGLVLVIGPGALQAVDPVGLSLAFVAAIGCAVYFAIAARTGDGLPPVALATFGLLLGGLVLALVGVSGLLPFTVALEALPLFGSVAPWWVPLLLLAVVSTAIAYAAGVTASEVLGSRLASFVGLLEVAFASVFAWLLLGERLTSWQMAGGALILAGIVAVQAERSKPETEAVYVATSTWPTHDPSPTSPHKQMNLTLG